MQLTDVSPKCFVMGINLVIKQIILIAFMDLVNFFDDFILKSGE